MTRKSLSGWLIAIIILFNTHLFSSNQRGAIIGKISDVKGTALNGAFLFIDSPSLIGVKTYLTSSNGRYIFLNLPGGEYKIIAERPGFKTVILEKIIVESGSIETVNIVLEPSDEEGLTIEQQPANIPDRYSASLTTVIDKDFLTRIPVARDFSSLLGLVPNYVFEPYLADNYLSTLGASFWANYFLQDGVNITHPVSGKLLSRINPSIVDELIIETAAYPVESGSIQGAFINVIQPEGNNNRLEGNIHLSHQARAFVKNLWTEEQIQSFGGATLPSPLRLSDFSLSLSTPLVEDYAWFFTSLRYKSQSRTTPFSRWLDPFELPHKPYNFSERTFQNMLKLSTRIVPEIGVSIDFSYSRTRQPVFENDVSFKRPVEATRSLSNEKFHSLKFGFDYAPDKNTIFNFSAGYANQKFPLLINRESINEAQYFETISGFTWGSGDYNEREKNNRLIINGTVIRYQDFILKTLHRLVAGLDYETTTTTSSVWKQNPLIMYFSGRLPYLYGYKTSPVSGNEVGAGLVGFWIAPSPENGLINRRDYKRIGLYLSDTITLADRLSINLSLRYDRQEAGFGAVAKSSSGSNVAYYVGENIVKPVLGFNLYGSTSAASWDRAIIWNSFSPRFSFSLDLIGTGSTILKGSYSRLPENLTLGYSWSITPFSPFRSHLFYWYDEDLNFLVDESDTFTMLEDDYRIYRSEFLKQSIDPNFKPPVMSEWTIGLEQQIFNDFSVSARLIQRTNKNLVGHVLYDPSTGARWYKLSDSPSGWWIPFSTIVPGSSNFNDTPVTIYCYSADAPPIFYRLENLPDLKSRYRGLELSFKKRMSHNWQFFGSIVFSKATGTTDLALPWRTGSSIMVINPNSFFNVDDESILNINRPFNLRLMQTIRLPWDLYLSSLFKASSGAPWSRTVTIIPPASWAEANGASQTPVTIYLERSGMQRYSAWKNLDFRLEKEFRKKNETKMTISVDVFNLLGNKYKLIDNNEGGLWLPDREGSNTGQRIFSSTYNKALLLRGTRVFQINFSLRF